MSAGAAAPPASGGWSSGDSLAPYVLASVFAHVGVALLFTVLAALIALLQPSRPLIDPDDVIDVTMVSLPAAQYAPVARDAVRPRDADPAPPTPQPPAAADAAPSLSPPSPAAPRPDAAPQEPKPERPAPDDPAARKALMQELEMSALLDDLAHDGAKAQDAASPTVDPTSTASRLIGPGSGDPDAARYIAQLQRLFEEHFRPLPTLRGQGLKVTVFVTVDDDGRVRTRSVEASSGNPSYDQAALSAVDNVATVPPPPPSLRDGTPDRYRIPFSD